MGRFFGSKPEWQEDSEFPSRMALHDCGIHPPTDAGISYSENEGADSIVLSGGYVDDKDYGDTIVYTGMGGRDKKTRRQIANQQFARGNKALALNRDQGLPVRVTRGAGHKSPYSPKTGYRYAGLYQVEDYWHEIGQHGFLVWRFRLQKLLNSDAVTLGTSDSGQAQRPAARQSTTVQRIVRDTAMAKRVKALHNYICQVCGIVIQTHAGPYAEAAHIKPLGTPHNGPDIEENVLCLCPNHHVMFDSGMFSVADDLSLIGLDGRLRTARKHRIGTEYLTYHRDHYGAFSSMETLDASPEASEE